MCDLDWIITLKIVRNSLFGTLKLSKLTVLFVTILGIWICLDCEIGTTMWLIIAVHHSVSIMRLEFC